MTEFTVKRVRERKVGSVQKVVTKGWWNKVQVFVRIVFVPGWATQHYLQRYFYARQLEADANQEGKG